MKQKILFIAETIDVDSSSAAKGSLALINTLIGLGYEVTIMHYSRKNIVLDNARVYTIPESKQTVYYYLSRAQRVLQRLLKRNFSKVVENIFGFSFTFKNDVLSIVNALKGISTPYSLIITRSKAASFRTHAALLKLPQFHDKWLAYVHDPYPFHCYPPPYNWQEAGYKQKEAFFRNVSEKAAFSAFPSQLLQEWMGNFFPNFLKTGIVLPHQDLDLETSNTEKNEVTYINTSSFVLLHAGSLLDHRNPFPLIEGYKKFLNNHPEANAQLVLIGGSAAHEPQLSKVCAAIPSIFKSDGYLPYAEVQQVQKLASVSIILEAVSHISPFLPGKFPHLVKANKPILHLGPKNSETRRLLGEKYPYSCAANDVDAIATCIEQLYAIWKNDKPHLVLNRADLENYISPSYIANQLNKKIKSL